MNTQDFWNEMQKAKEAIEKVPQLESQLAEAQRQSALDGNRIAAHEITIHQLRGEIDNYSQKLRSVEAERDEATFHRAASEDKAAGLVRSIRSAMGELDGILHAVESNHPLRSTLENTLHNVQKDNDSLRSMLDERTAEMDRLNARMKDLTDQLDMLREDFRTMQASRDAARTERDQYKAMLEDLTRPQVTAEAPVVHHEPFPFEPLDVQHPVDPVTPQPEHRDVVPGGIGDNTQVEAGKAEEPAPATPTTEHVSAPVAPSGEVTAEPEKWSRAWWEQQERQQNGRFGEKPKDEQQG